jgi:hypothetical protein
MHEIEVRGVIETPGRGGARRDFPPSCGGATATRLAQAFFAVKVVGQVTAAAPALALEHNVASADSQSGCASARFHACANASPCADRAYWLALAERAWRVKAQAGRSL